VDANDTDAICNLGGMYLNGHEGSGIKKDVDKAVELLHRAAELGSAEAYHNLGSLYHKGEGVNKDEKKAKQYYEKGVMAGCPDSRLHVGNFDADAGSFDRAIKHWLIAASSGDIRAVNNMKRAMTMRKATSDHYAQALRGYQKYLDEVRSAARDRAAAYNDEWKYLPDTQYDQP
jgi:TPR repeat protein